MKSLAFVLTLGTCLISIPAVASSTIPAGTVLPVRLNASLDLRKAKPGQAITASIMQDVPVPAGKIRAGTKVVGQILEVTPSAGGNRGQVRLRFDTVRLKQKEVRVSTSLRALASMLEVEEAQIPTSGADRGTPWAWTTRNLIGGEVAYGQGGPVAQGDTNVGEALMGGVLAPVRANTSRGCRAEINENDNPQALWVFSSDACGVYGIEGLEIANTGRAVPAGEITLEFSRQNAKVRGGSGMLLLVNQSDLQ